MKQFVLQGNTILVDDEDYTVAKRYSTNILFQPTGAINSVIMYMDGKTLRLHRVIMNANTGQIVDHINGNVLDNRKCNLRFVTKAQNAFNRRVHKVKKSGLPKGVSLDKTTGKYRAQISWMGSRTHLGLFISITEAENAYLKAAEFYFGNHAHHVSQTLTNIIN